LSWWNKSWILIESITILKCAQLFSNHVLWSRWNICSYLKSLQLSRNRNIQYHSFVLIGVLHLQIIISLLSQYNYILCFFYHSISCCHWFVILLTRIVHFVDMLYTYTQWWRGGNTLLLLQSTLFCRSTVLPE